MFGPMTFFGARASQSRPLEQQSCGNTDYQRDNAESSHLRSMLAISARLRRQVLPRTGNREFAVFHAFGGDQFVGQPLDVAGLPRTARTSKQLS